MRAASGEDASRAETGRAVPGWIAWAAGLACLAGGLYLLRVERLDASGVSGGVLLLVAALGFLAVALGQMPYGPDVEGRLDLSARLGAGLLGGALGAAAYLAAAAVVEGSGLPRLVGVGLQTPLSGGELWGRMAFGAVWGVAFGVLAPWLPGRGLVARALIFSLAPALYVLVEVFPEEFKYGLFGVELGALTFLFVVLYHLVWGATTGAVMRWAERTDHGPVSRPLGA